MNNNERATDYPIIRQFIQRSDSPRDIPFAEDLKASLELRLISTPPPSRLNILVHLKSADLSFNPIHLLLAIGLYQQQ